MSRLALTLALGDYDHTRDLASGAVRADGIDLTHLNLSIEETFFRFLKFRETAFRDPKSYFRRFAELSNEEAVTTARGIWREINGLNLRENILPTRERARLILEKGSDHLVRTVRLRKL